VTNVATDAKYPPPTTRERSLALNKYGALAFTWIGDWNAHTGTEAIQKASAAGLDVLEIPLLDPANFDPEAFKGQLAEHGVEPYCTLVLPPKVHLPFDPEGAQEFLGLALEKVEALGCGFLGGGLYANAGTITGKPPTGRERELCAGVLREVAQDAAGRGITLAIEPFNRYETYLYNTVEDGLRLLDAIGEENVGLHLDTYHMNIEEHGFYEPVVAAGDRLLYVHASESDRGMPGAGNVHWDDLFQGLAEIRYGGPLVIEAFADPPPALVEAIRMWRPSGVDPDALVRDGVSFLREKARKAGLA
jgi:D-psicose/D-tagatose/L-ribulose 3-epimerase